MSRPIAGVLGISLLAVLFSSRGQCQEPAKAPAFEVASIKLCEPGTAAPAGQESGMVRFTYPGGRFQADAVTLKVLFEWAYGVLPFQHSRGPSWSETDRYDVVAKAAGKATDPEVKRMLQTLLAERFQLKFHRETRNLPAYIISLGKTEAKLFPPKDGELHSLTPTPRTDSEGKVVSWHVIAVRYSLADLTDIFARQLGRVIVNKTGLDGDFDFTLDLTPDDNRPNPLDPSLIITAMREQLGLTLKTETAPVDYFIVDSAEKPTAN
ncbi:MAG TPA: TIGR03435 family protein [Candidatus Sulfopaludibacter sp.]|nr:TIGR03435 family protein [Candidatus Sulfopaludibacter sp.]